MREGGATVLLLDVYETFTPPGTALAADMAPATPNAIGQPERNLLIAILTDAVVRYRRYRTIRGPLRGRFAEAERWIFSDDRRWVFSFVNVCEALGIEPRAVRRAVAAGRIGFASQLRTTAQSKDTRPRHRST
jgi:hypothetical protein